MSSGARRVGLCVVVLAAFVLLSLTAMAQAPREGDAVKEQSIYIPYKKLRDVFEKEGRVVFLPYDKFMELWKDRLERTPTVEPMRPPVDSLISEITNTATVSKDVVTVTSTLKIEVLKDGWNEVPLRLRDAAITKATLDGAPARIVFDAGSGYKLLVEKKPALPLTCTLVLEFARAYTKAPGQNSVSFETPQAPVSKWEVRVPESGVKVNIQPLIAATEAPPAAKIEETVMLAFVGAAPTVRIDWTPKAEGAKGLAALSSVSVEQQMEIEEGVTRTRARLIYTISRAELSSLVIEVPADQKVVNVFDPNVREWTVEPAGATQKITVQLFEPAKSSQNLTVEMQKFVADATQEIGTPIVKAVGVGRQQGVVVVRVAEALRSEALKRTGLLQVDASELPAALANTKWHYSYRYAALPFELVLSVEKIKPHIEADTLVEAHLQPEELTLDVLSVYNIERAGVFRLDLTVPEGYDVRYVRGFAINGGAAAQVDTHHVEGAGNTSLVVNLSRKAMGRVGLEIQLNRKLREPDLLSPTGKSASIPLVLPRVAAAGIARQSGRVIVYAPESLRVNPSENKGLRSISFAEATAGMRSTASGAVERAVIAFAFTDEPVSLTLAGDRRKPQVTARQFVVARVEPGVVTYDVTITYDILYSGVKSLRLDVPKELAGDIRVAAPISYQVEDETVKPEGLADGYVAWRLTGETEFLGTARVSLKWEKKIEKLDIGKSVNIDVPRLRPMGTDRAWGQIVLTKAETIDVRPEKTSDSLRPIDPQHDLMAGASVAGAARAFEFHEDWQLTVSATQYKLQEVKRTSIDRAVVRMVLTRGNETRVQAIYRMRSQQQRLYIKLPGNSSFDTEPLRINGRAVTLEQGDVKNNIYSVPLVAQSQDEAFLLDLRYRVNNSGMRLECPVFPEDAADAGAGDEPAVQKVYLSVYLPEELAWLGSMGPWTDEMVWVHMRGFTFRPMAAVEIPGLGSAGYESVDAKLIRWVSEGVGIDATSLRNFETDGHQYLFSTLRPVAPPKGALRLVAMKDVYLSVIMLIVVIAGGLSLVRSRLAAKCLAAGSFVVALVLLAVFFPTFARHIADGTLLASVFIVLVVWALWWVVTTFSLRRPKASAPPPPPEAKAPDAGNAAMTEGGQINA